MRSDRPCSARAFTLIELILVMALLIIVVSLVMPLLGRFLGNRGLDSEVRRFVALTHYAQSRAVSEGIPMLLWIDPKAGAYGLREETSYADKDEKAMEYAVASGLVLGVDKNNPKATGIGKSMGIHFSPDGNVITATSLAAISIQQGNEQPVWIVQSPDKLTYEVRN